MNCSLPEMNLYGDAHVLSIESCNVDSRDASKGQSVVIGKFIHENAEDLIFQNEDGKQEKLEVQCAPCQGPLEEEKRRTKRRC